MWTCSPEGGGGVTEEASLMICALQNITAIKSRIVLWESCLARMGDLIYSGVCYNEQILSVKSECYNERGEILSFWRSTRVHMMCRAFPLWLERQS
jgi:hypothetical protein